jgi:hypothetical protein
VESVFSGPDKSPTKISVRGAKKKMMPQYQQQGSRVFRLPKSTSWKEGSPMCTIM